MSTKRITQVTVQAETKLPKFIRATSQVLTAEVKLGKFVRSSLTILYVEVVISYGGEAPAGRRQAPAVQVI